MIVGQERQLDAFERGRWDLVRPGLAEVSPPGTKLPI
jgi:hypothetical protein